MIILDEQKMLIKFDICSNRKCEFTALKDELGNGLSTNLERGKYNIKINIPNEAAEKNLPSGTYNGLLAVLSETQYCGKFQFENDIVTSEKIELQVVEAISVK